MINEYLIKQFEMYYPWYVDKVDEYLLDEIRGELIIRLKDGTLMSYYPPEKDLRDIPVPGECDEETIREEFGIRLYRRMMRFGILQSDLSKTTGIPQSQLSNYVNGKRMPSFSNLIKIAEALNCDLDYFQIFRKF